MHLFAHLIDDCFQLKANGGQGLVEGLGTQRIGFAVEFLGQKIKLAARRFGRSDQGAGRFEVGKQAVQFLLNVSAGGNQDRFLMQPVLVKACTHIQQF